MLYEITTDCRIAGKDYKKGDVVTIAEVWQYFTTVMKPIREDIPSKKAAVKEDAKPVIEEPKEIEEPKAPVTEKAKEEPKKASKKKK